MGTSTPTVLHCTELSNIEYNFCIFDMVHKASFSMSKRGSLIFLLVVLVCNSVSTASIPEHVLKDPSFIQCLNQHAGADPADYVNVVATCYGFVGRPRFGKRYDPLSRRLPSYRSAPSIDYDWN